MALIVKKFGGTSVGDVSRLRSVAERIERTYKKGNQVAVVVSAISGVTNDLVAKCKQAAPLHDAREYDAVVSSGEQVSAGLLAMILQDMGIPARSWLGWQIPIRTDDHHGAANIQSIETEDLHRRMQNGEVPIIAGFQGLGSDNRITTLGRGGSDLTAVAMAAALGADRCDIYTDVPGVYSADPRLVPTAKRLSHLGYEEMLSFAAEGAKVLDARSVAYAMKAGVVLRVLSSFEHVDGTLIVESGAMPKRDVSGIALSARVAKITLVGIKDEPGTVAAIFAPLTTAKMDVRMIVQDVSQDGQSTNVTFTVDVDDAERAVDLIAASKSRIGYSDISIDKNVVKITVVGPDLDQNIGMAQILFDALGSRGINIQAISTSEVKISVLVADNFAEDAVRVLHSAYGLDHKQ